MFYSITVKGENAYVAGLAGDRTVHYQERSLLVLKRKGYGENPGSRYSRLYSYYPAEFEVYQNSEHGQYIRIAVFPVKKQQHFGEEA